MLMHTNLIAADAAAVQATVRLVATVTDDQLTWPTPCQGWELAALLDHMTDQHHIFATAASGPPPATEPSAPAPTAGRDSAAAFGPATPAAERVSAYAAAADRVLAVFSEAGML